MIWNLKSTITYKRVLLPRTSVYFAISELILLLLYSFHIACIIFSNVYFLHFILHFDLYFNRSQAKASVVNQISHLFFDTQKYCFWSFELLKNGHIHYFSSMLIKVVKLDVENINIFSTLSNVNINVDNVGSTLFNVVNFNVDIHNVVSTLIWHVSTSRCYITLIATLRQPWYVCWVLKNVAKKIHNFVNHTYLAEYLLIATFVSFRKGIDRIILV